MNSQTSPNLQELYSIPESLSNTQLHEFCENNANAWAPNLYVSRDFRNVIKNGATHHDAYLRPVMWIARIENIRGASKEILILLSPYECNRLLPYFRESKKSTLMMYRPRLSQSHSNLICDVQLHITGRPTSNQIERNIEVQIGMFAGAMYFATEEEQNAYCDFLGLIPQPWDQEFNKRYGRIFPPQSKGFVPITHRQYSPEIFDLVGLCEFNDSPVNFAIKLIEARYQMLLKESHVASILERGRKMEIPDVNDDEDDAGQIA